MSGHRRGLNSIRFCGVVIGVPCRRAGNGNVGQFPKLVEVLSPFPTDALVSCLKNSTTIYVKTAPTCFGVTVTPSSGGALIRAY